LKKIPAGKKTTFDKAVIEELFREYQNNDIDDTWAYETVRGAIKGRNVLIIAPGGSVTREKDKIKAYIEKTKPIVFAINQIPKDYKADFVFLSNARRYNQLMYDIIQTDTDARFIITSNITAADKNKKIVFNFAPLRIDVADISDNAVLLLIKILKKLDIGTVTVAGFDGFSAGAGNYSADYSALCNIPDTAAHNAKIIAFLKNSGGVKLNFLTESKYDV
jgi:4-hydroxy 2-oxovalerate aldolase